MSILSTTALSKYFGVEEVFSDVDVAIPQDGKIALVGPNGAGKTTLVNILIGKDNPSDGTINRKKNLRIGLLPQRPVLDATHTLWDEMLTAFTHLRTREEKLNALEHALANPEQSDNQEELLERYGRLQHAFEDAGGYTYEIEIRRVLMGLSFKESDFQRPLDQLSGGQTTRALLARLLLESPELLVLDEPTNHLDIAAVEWLENYLKSWPGALLIVSHDRYFMDQVVDTVWELDFGGIETYRGNYSHYAQQRQERFERRMKEYESQQEFIQKELEYIERNIAGQNTRQAQGRRKRLERMMSGTDRRGRTVDNQWLLKKPRRREQMHFKLKGSRTGNNVLRTYDLIVGYPDDDGFLFEVPDILLLRGEVAAVIGPNGAGKTTFIKTVLGNMDALDGDYEWGARVQVGYFAQGHEELNPAHTLMDELLSIKNLAISEARNYLARYLFQGEDVHRPVGTLSGGERGRLALAKLSLGGASVLLLDEPSNHLDMPSQEILQNVLADYEGTILLVSHDRYLIDALATQIWAIEDNQLHIFKGNYHEYIADREARKQEQRETRQQADSTDTTTRKSSNTKHPSGLNPYEREKRREFLETKIERLEQTLAQISEELENASATGQIEKVTDLGHRYTELQQTLHETMEEWLLLSES